MTPALAQHSAGFTAMGACCLLVSLPLHLPYCRVGACGQERPVARHGGWVGDCKYLWCGGVYLVLGCSLALGGA